MKFSNGGKATVEQILESDENNKSKEQGFLYWGGTEGVSLLAKNLIILLTRKYPRINYPQMHQIFIPP